MRNLTSLRKLAFGSPLRLPTLDPVSHRVLCTYGTRDVEFVRDRSMPVVVHSTCEETADAAMALPAAAIRRIVELCGGEEELQEGHGPRDHRDRPATSRITQNTPDEVATARIVLGRSSAPK